MAADNDRDDELLERFEREALFNLADEPDDELDVVGALTGEEALAQDITLGGYIAEHDRVPAFEGSDGQPYTVDIDVEPAEDADNFAAFLMFIRWAETGAGIMSHLESGDLAFGDTAEAARAAALDLSLYEIKAELDAAIERRRSHDEEV